MEKMYVIVSLKHSDNEGIAFWRPDNAGYTTNPWAAGFYTEDQVRKDQAYYNDGVSTVAICINNSSIPDSGLSIRLSSNQVRKYRKENKGQISYQQPVTSNQ